MNEYTSLFADYYFMFGILLLNILTSIFYFFPQFFASKWTTARKYNLLRTFYDEKTYEEYEYLQERQDGSEDNISEKRKIQRDLVAEIEKLRTIYKLSRVLVVSSTLLSVTLLFMHGMLSTQLSTIISAGLLTLLIALFINWKIVVLKKIDHLIERVITFSETYNQETEH